VKIALTWVCNQLSWGAPKFPFSLKSNILLLSPSSILDDALFQGTGPLLVANFLSWYVADSIRYTAVHFFDNFIGDFTNELAL